MFYLVIALAYVLARLSYNYALGVAASMGFEHPGFLWMVGIGAAAVPVYVLVHETGHWLAGAAFGWQCTRFGVGPVEFRPMTRSWHFHRISKIGGMVTHYPATFVGFRQQKALCSLGGPLFSLVGTVIFTSLALLSRTALSFWFCVINAQFSMIGVLELCPFNRGHIKSDGYQVWEMCRGGSHVDELLRDMLTETSKVMLLRPGEWPTDLILRIVDIPADPSVKRYALYLAYIHFLDKGDAPRSGRYLRSLLEQWTSSDPPEYALEAAYFFAAHERDAAAGRKWLETETRDAEPWVRQRAQAAVEWAGARPDRSHAIVEQALTALRKERVCGDRLFEIVRLEELSQSAVAISPEPEAALR